MSFAIIANFIRKWKVPSLFKLMLIKSQIRFLIPWALQILIVYLFFRLLNAQQTFQVLRIFTFHMSPVA